MTGGSRQAGAASDTAHQRGREFSIGETLAGARRAAGLTATEVSRATRIRERLVQDIERDEYSGCGGDFYARGHIRAIARVVGTDPEPLIEQYDVALRPVPEETPADAAEQSAPARAHGWRWRRHPFAEHAAEAPPRDAPRAMPGTQPYGGPPAYPAGAASGQVSLAGMSVPPPRREPPREPPTEPFRPALPAEMVGAPPRRKPPFYPPPSLTPIRVRGGRNWPVLFGIALVAVVGVLGYSFVAGSIRNLMTAPAAGSHVPPGQSGAALAGGTVVVSLTALRPSSVEFTTPGGKYLFRADLAAGASKRWTFRHPVTMTVGDPAGVRLVVNGKNPLPHRAARPVALSLRPGRPASLATSAVAPAPATAPSTLTPARAVAFGVSGPGHGDNPQRARLAIDHSPATAWATDWYASARFGNLYPGTGLLLDMGRPVTITGARVSLGSAPGASFQLRVGSAPALAGLTRVARAAGASGVVSLHLTTPAHGRYVLIWFTKVPLNSHGHFQATVHNVILYGRA